MILFLLLLQLKMKVCDPAVRQMIRLGRNAGPQKRNPVLVEDHQLRADILDGMTDIIDDNTLQGRPFRLIEVRAGALDDHFMR